MHNKCGVIHLLPLLLIGIIIIAVGYGAYYFGKNSNTPLLTKSSPEPEGMMENDETSDWRTYTNTEWGYSIKYPEGGKTANIADGNTAIGALPSSRQISISTSEDLTNNAISIAAFDVLELTPGSGWTRTEVEVNGILATKWTKDDGNAKYNIYYIEHKNKGLLEIYVSNQNENKEIANQILSTFEFVENTNENTAWKTYNGKTVPIKVQYPSYYVPRELDDLGPNSYRIEFLAESGDVQLSSFTISQSTSGVLPQYPYDQEPTGNYTVSGIKGIYQELPEGYQDAANISPQPMLSVYIVNEGKLYEISFFGVSEISNPVIKQILSTFEFTN